MTTFNDLLKFWYDAEIAKLFASNDRGDGRLLLTCPVWGKEYTERLIDWCLPSIMSKDNLAALAGRARLLLFVDPAHHTDIAFVLRSVEHQGIELRLLQIPEEIIKEWRGASSDVRRSWAYHMLGIAQDIAVQTAGRFGMDLHVLQPDHTYNMRYFPNLFRLATEHQAITQIGVCAEVEEATKQLQRFRQPNGSLAVPDVELGNIAFRNLHARTKPFLMNARASTTMPIEEGRDASIPDRMPNSHVMVWQGRDKLVLSSCHMNPAYLSTRLCAGAPRFAPFSPPATMDSCLPAIIKDTPFFVPDANAGLTFAELSGPEKQPAVGDKVPFEEFARSAWGQARFRLDYLEYTKRRCEMPIKPQNKFLSDADIVAQHERVIDMMVKGRGDGAALAFCLSVFRKEGEAVS